MPAIDIVSDANVALKWFHERGEEEVLPARELLARHRARAVVLHVLDLTFYEVGNALLRGSANATASQVAVVLGALREVVLTVNPDDDDFALATELADAHGLTFYDAAYAAVAQRRGARLLTLDRQLLGAGLGSSPSETLARLDSDWSRRRRAPSVSRSAL
jgi:predicted nucleic acid-binding protein